MFSKIFPLLNKFLPPTLAAKALGKMDSRFARFFTNTLASGYATDKALSFLRNRFMGEKDENEQQLEQGQAQGTLRPDEQASLQNIKHSQAIPNAIGTAASMAPVIGAGISALGSGKGQGQVQQEPQIQQPQQAQPTASMNMDIRSVIQEKNPQLDSLIARVIDSKNSPEDAAKVVKTFPDFRFIIKELENMFQSDLTSLIKQGYKKEGGKSNKKDSLKSSLETLSKIFSQ